MDNLGNTIKELLNIAADKFSTNDAVRYKEKKESDDGKKETVVAAKTYAQLKEDSEKLSAMLENMGELGGHIAILGPNSYPWLVSYLGITGSGSVAVPLDAGLPAPDLIELLNRAHITTLIYDKNFEPVAELSKEQCPELKNRICMQTELMDELAKYQPGFAKMPEPEDLATILYTSGTTGKSKGVMLTHGNLADNATCLDMKLPSDTVILSVLPIHHAYCLSMDILKGISLGSTICINDSLLRVVQNIQLFQPNMILMVPLMIATFAKQLEELSNVPPEMVKVKVFGPNLHTICSGGAYLNPAYIDLFNKYGIRILQGYGMTECSPVISTNLPWKIKQESVGKLLPNCEGKTVDGELWVRGSSVMQGYYEMPDETKEALEDGWLKTGDLGYVDEEGYVFLTGRKKNLIITANGENVSPEEIENKFDNHRIVQEILVREKDNLIEAEIFPDYDYAAKTGVEDIQKNLQDLIDAYNNEAPLYKRISSLKVRDVEFEKNSTRKIKRF